MSENLPAWTKESVFLQVPTQPTIENWSPEWAMGGATGAGVRVAVVDSGIEADHPMLNDCVDTEGSMDFTVDADGAVVATQGPHEDVYGHGTACAGIIHALAPEASITSVRVLGPGLRGKAAAFHAGLQWAVDEGFDVINLSLGASKRDWAFPFHEVCDRGYFANSFIVTAANNIQRVSFPSLYASVTSVACNTTDDPLRYHFNPEPPTEFLARGIDVEVPWLNGETTVTTGNSFAAPHIAAFAALIRSKHPDMRPFHVKSLLWACAANVRDASATFEAADTGIRPAPSVGRGTVVLKAAVPPTDPTESAESPKSPESPKSTEPVKPRASAATADFGRTQMMPAAPPATDPTATIHASFDDITVEGHLADGPWGTVFAGVRSDGDTVAIRYVPQSAMPEAGLAERFIASVQAAAGLEHPHVLPIQEMVELDAGILIVMPLAASNLGDLKRPIELADACLAAMSLLAGLTAAHRHGVFHGDLRPQNALIDTQQRVVVSDSGLAAPLQSNARTLVRFNGNDWTYRAPELAIGGAVGAHTDVYAVGAILYELITADAPRARAAGLADLVAAATDPTPMAPLPDTVPAQLQQAISHALAADPAYRWGAAADFAAAIASACYQELGPDWATASQFTYSG